MSPSREISNDLARHNAEHAQMLDRLEAIHLLEGKRLAILEAIANGQKLEDLVSKPPL